MHKSLKNIARKHGCGTPIPVYGNGNCAQIHMDMKLDRDEIHT